MSELSKVVENLGMVRKTLSWRVRKSNKLSNLLEDLMRDVASAYNAAEHAALFNLDEVDVPSPVFSKDVGQMVFNLYDQIRGSCFQQFGDLLDFLRRVLLNYAKLISNDAEKQAVLKNQKKVMEKAVNTMKTYLKFHLKRSTKNRSHDSKIDDAGLDTMDELALLMDLVELNQGEDDDDLIET